MTFTMAFMEHGSVLLAFQKCLIGHLDDDNRKYHKGGNTSFLRRIQSLKSPCVEEGKTPDPNAYGVIIQSQSFIIVFPPSSPKV